MSESMPESFKCPTCRKRFAAGKYFPFCSDRCKTIDLGRWLDGAYQIPVKPNPGEEDETGDGVETVPPVNP